MCHISTHCLDMLRRHFDFVVLSRAFRPRRRWLSSTIRFSRWRIESWNLVVSQLWRQHHFARNKARRRLRQKNVPRSKVTTSRENARRLSSNVAAVCAARAFPTCSPARFVSPAGHAELAGRSFRDDQPRGEDPARAEAEARPHAGRQGWSWPLVCCGRWRSPEQTNFEKLSCNWECVFRESFRGVAFCKPTVFLPTAGQSAQSAVARRRLDEDQVSEHQPAGFQQDGNPENGRGKLLLTSLRFMSCTNALSRAVRRLCTLFRQHFLHQNCFLWTPCFIVQCSKGTVLTVTS